MSTATNAKQVLCLSCDLNERRVERLQKQLGCLKKELDSQGGKFCYLRLGKDESELDDTRPIALAFDDRLDDASESEIREFLTAKDSEIYAHYLNRTVAEQPVMYLLYPSSEESGLVAFILPQEGGLKQRDIRIFELGSEELKTRIERLKQIPIGQNILCSVPQVERLFYEPIKTAKELAQELAKAARQIEEIIPKLYRQEAKDGYLHQLLESFHRELLPNLKVKADDDNDYSFADIYAQTVAYTLFTARVFTYVKDKDREVYFDRVSAWQYLPETNPFLRNLFKDISERKVDELGDELIGAIADIFMTLRKAEMETILQDFENKNNREDIVIRFYEDFLEEYNPSVKEVRGVYYSPKSCVGYIVRSVDHILKKYFDLANGLADTTQINSDSQNSEHKVLIVDVATGTGTFLSETIDHIHQSFTAKGGNWSEYVDKHLLTRISGFELLMAPYAVAHLQLGLKLAELGYQFNITNTRLDVCLTNTLSESFQIPVQSEFASWIRSESVTAKKFKQDAPVMVLMGNPPYSGHSANNGDWIKGLLRGYDSINSQQTGNYFEVDGKPLGEKNPKWLNDDYVKFIRFAQWRIEQTGYGILAFITNHGYLDNPTFRGMRQSLMQTFDDIYVLDLHGNSKKKEKCPDGSKDENIFDIQQGVSVCFMIKRQNSIENTTNIYHADLYGMRDVKYEWLEKHDISTTEWKKLNPQSSFYLFKPQNTDLLPEYETGWKVTDIFPVSSVGIVTGRDELTIQWSEEEVTEIVNDFAHIPTEIARAKYNLGDDSRDWKVNLAQLDLKDCLSDKSDRGKVTKMLYRPFDSRCTYYTGRTKGFQCMPRRTVMNHILAGDNLGLLCMRQVSPNEDFNHFMVTDSLIHNRVLYSSKGMMIIAPMYLYLNSNDTQQELLEQTKEANFAPEFLTKIEQNLGYLPTPEAIFYYIYAIFHSPEYRSRYADFLKIDFPRVPLTTDDKLFRQLAKLGKELVELHLMKSEKIQNSPVTFIERDGNKTIDPGHPKYDDKTQSAIINKQGDKFTEIPPAVWNFHVGSYQVLAKWLKDRKGRVLSKEDIQHYRGIVVALSETIRVMGEIDKAIPSFPIQ